MTLPPSETSSSILQPVISIRASEHTTVLVCILSPIIFFGSMYARILISNILVEISTISHSTSPLLSNLGHSYPPSVNLLNKATPSDSDHYLASALSFRPLVSVIRVQHPSSGNYMQVLPVGAVAGRIPPIPINNKSNPVSVEHQARHPAMDRCPPKALTVRSHKEPEWPSNPP